MTWLEGLKEKFEVYVQCTGLEKKLVLWASIYHILLAGHHFLLIVVHDFVNG